MTKLSVNINKIALLRNARGRNFPDVRDFAARCLQLGAHGITLHPRPDQRHARYSDVAELRTLCAEHGAELNVEGYPTPDFIDVVMNARPAQCTLVPDAPAQLTSDHGWDVAQHAEMLAPIIARLGNCGIRTSLFVDATYEPSEIARELGADRIELYTEPYALAFGTQQQAMQLAQFRTAAARARAVGLGVNAGHDLNLENLPAFLRLGDILEVSIGHALTVECLYHGIDEVIPRYVRIVNGLSGE